MRKRKSPQTSNSENTDSPKNSRKYCNNRYQRCPIIPEMEELIFDSVEAKPTLNKDEYMEIVNEHSLQVAEEVRVYEREPAFMYRFSYSSLIGFSIWSCIALIVFLLVNLNFFDKTNKTSHSVMGKIPCGNGSGFCFPIDEGDFSCDPNCTVRPELLPNGCKYSFIGKFPTQKAFGEVLGAHHNVSAFSNYNSETCISMVDNFIDFRLPTGDAASRSEASPSLMFHNPPDKASTISYLKGPKSMSNNTKQNDRIRIHTGMQWQCVEYARRYWLLTGRPKPVYFSTVDGAADIWNELTEVHLLDGTTMPLHKHANGAPPSLGGSPPQAGDLLLYPRNFSECLPYGHVAVIVGVDWPSRRVFLAEQNWDATRWPGPYHNYSRVLPLHVQTSDEAGPRYFIEDPESTIVGWVRYTQPEKIPQIFPV